MKILIVCSGNNNRISPFITDQVEVLNSLGIITDYFLVKGKGILGYLSYHSVLREKLRQFQPDLVHAHYGFSGLLSTTQRKVPVIITFHGSDINYHKNRLFSLIGSFLAKDNIFVSEKLARKLKNKKSNIIPCGVDISLFRPREKVDCKKYLGLDENKKYILFPSAFDNTTKNYLLAKTALEKLNEKNVVLLELKGLTREHVAYLFNAIDLVLLTSFTEGSPQVIKEAMACNCPIVSTNVGDVKEVIGETKGCYICSYDPIDVAHKISSVISFNNRTLGRQRIIELGLDSISIAKRIIVVYENVLNERN